MSVIESAGPTVEIDPAEQTRLFAEVVATAGQILAERQVDCYVNVGFYSDGLDSNRRTNDVRLTSFQGGFLMAGDYWRGRTECSSDTISYVPGAPSEQHVEREQLRQNKAGELRRVVERSVNDGPPELLGDQPATPHAITDMLESFRMRSDELAPDNPAWAVLGDSYCDTAMVEADRLIPVAGILLGVVGEAMKVERPEGKHLQADVTVDVGVPGGRLYGEGMQRKQGIYIGATDRDQQTSVEFRLDFRPGPMLSGTQHEYAFVQSSIVRISRDRGRIVVTKDDLGQRGDKAYVTRRQRVSGEQATTLSCHEVVGDTIIRMAREATVLVSGQEMSDG